MLAAAQFAVAGLLAAALLGTVAGRSRAGSVIVYALCLLAASALVLVALAVLTGLAGPAETAVLPVGLPWLGAHFRLDSLSGFFLLVVDLSAVTASLYGLGAGGDDPDRSRILPCFPLFLAGMNAVLLADDAFTFLFAWELMSLSSWALVMAHDRSPASSAAGLVYLIMAAIGTMALLLAFGLLAGPDGHYAFADIRQMPHAAWVIVTAFGLAVLGAGSKAGIVPLHAWLPLAHPAAPSHVSALMSGAMTKVALYGMIRLLFDLIGPPDWWWGAILIALGGVTAVLGVLQAVLESDLKRLLAYSTVDNVGLAVIGLGLAAAFQANGMTTACAVAFTAALLHIFNHSLFKTLLFCGAGAVITATGTADMDAAGGLARRMPLAAAAMFVGAAAIAALPPLNGFASEWLTLQAILLSPDLPQWLMRFLVPAVGVMLALAAALAAACFVKAFGITFLGRPRSTAAAGAGSPRRLVLAALWLPAGLCIVTGLVPGAVIALMDRAVAQIVGTAAPAAEAAWLTLIPVAPERSAYSPLIVVGLVALFAVGAVVLLRRLGPAARRAPAWDCGFPDPSPLTQYSAAGFSQPIRRTFAGGVLRAAEQVDMPLPGDPRPARLAVTSRDMIWDHLYHGAAALVMRAADLVNPVQFLTVRRYLVLMFGALLILLIGLSVWR